MIFKSPKPDIDIPNISLPELILERAVGRGAQPALIDGPSGRTLSYGQLSAMCQRLAAGLQGRGLQKGDIVALYLPNLPEYAVLVYGTGLAGGIITTVSPLYTAAELSHQLRDTRARFLVTVPPFLSTAQEGAAEAFVEEIFVLGEAEGATPFGTLMQAGGQPTAVPINPAADTAVILYSSGTTGMPKGVMLSHRNLVANSLILKSSVGSLGFEPEERILAVAPFFHSMGLTILLNTAMLCGSTVVTLSRFDLPQFLGLMQDQHINMTILPPPVVLLLAKHPLVDSYDFSALRLIVSGAAPLGGEVEAAAAARLGCQITQGYGLTEFTAAAHTDNLENGRITGSVGQPMVNTEVQIVDPETGEALGPGERGELWLRGPQVMLGYLNNAAATAAMIDRDGWLHTGDIATIDANGYTFIVDRLKELIKYKGYQVAPAELEAILLSHPAVADACVIGKPDAAAGELPKAYVVLKGEATADDLIAYVAERVAPYKKIREVAFCAAIPKLPTGKILRRVLVAQERQLAAA